MKARFYFSFFMIALVILVASAVNASQASAHRLNVFAWLKGDQVVVECNFGENRPAKDAVVSIMDSTDKKELAHGVTNDAGLFVFRVPQVVRQGHGISIDVNAGFGHRNTWHMDPSELYEAAALEAGFEEAAINGQTGEQPSAPTTAETEAAVRQQESARAQASTQADNQNIPLPEQRVITTPQVSAPVQPDSVDHVRKAIREEIASQMEPVHRQIAQAATRGPSFTEIVGGIGWIVGIIGIVLYFLSRRRKEV